jgi:uncharacterized C2H2 Zn-finger protein
MCASADGPPAGFRCEYCGHIFTTIQERKDHINKYHSSAT